MAPTLMTVHVLACVCSFFGVAFGVASLAHSWTSLSSLTSDVVCRDVFPSGTARTTNTPESTEPFYKISINSSFYYLNQNLQVNLSCGTAFRGFIVQMQTFDTHRPVGRFQPLSTSTSHIDNCTNGLHNTISTWYTEPESEARLIWTAPATDVGAVYLRVAFITTPNAELVNITSQKISKGFHPIDLSSCGDTKGCFRQSTGIEETTCDYDTCEYIFTYERDGTVAHFELMANADWVAVGFSSDELMGGDDILMCAQTHGEVSVGHYWTEVPYVAPKLQSNNPLTNQSTHLSNSRTACRFTRPLKVNGDDRSLDLNNEWYQLYAWGPTYNRQQVMKHTRDSPPTSHDLITLMQNRNTINSATALVTSHNIVPCALMVVVWITLKQTNIVCGSE